MHLQQRDKLTRGIVTAVYPLPRLYIIDTERDTTARRNRRQLYAMHESRHDTRPSVPVTSPDIAPAAALPTVIMDIP
jgi:hypothetical protein